MLHRLRAGLRAQFQHRGLPRVAVESGGPDLDEAMGGKRARGLRDHRGGQPAVADADHRGQGVGLGLEFAARRGRERVHAVL